MKRLLSFSAGIPEYGFAALGAFGDNNIPKDKYRF